MATFVPSKRFKRVDLPTFGGPTIAMKPERKLDCFDSLVAMMSWINDHRPLPCGADAGYWILDTG
jgi:hypothetical protein